MVWAGDCLRLTVPRHKGDQTGDVKGKDKHIHANPLKPALCPILALARETVERSGQCELFTKDDVNRFGVQWRRLLGESGLIPDDIDFWRCQRRTGTPQQ